MVTIGPSGKPGQYRTALPDSVRIDYRIRVSANVSDAAASAPRDAGSAQLRWDTDGSSYRLAVDGVLGALRSEGGLDDAGIAPQRSSAQRGAGQATTLFDRAGGQIVDAVSGHSAQWVAGSQDAASVLLQLSGIGQSDPDQLRSTLGFWIGGVHGARMAYFEMAGRERLETALGTLETVRLVRLDQAGAAQLEVWLAPEHGWLPVQLRLTGADGAVQTQTVAAITLAATP